MPATNSPAKTILLAGFIAGCCDITAALVLYCTMLPLTPVRLLQGIAAGILGRQAAYSGGGKTAVLGFVCHFVIALGAAAVYFALTRVFTFLTRNLILSAAIWGSIVYFFMQYVVLPLSRIGMPRFNVKFTIIGLIIHFFCIGLPIAAITRRHR